MFFAQKQSVIQLRSEVLNYTTEVHESINMEHWRKDTDKGNRSVRRKPCPSATLSTTNLILIGLGLKQSLRSWWPATFRLCHGTVSLKVRHHASST
jgi:hypothetical protein